MAFKWGAPNKSSLSVLSPCPVAWTSELHCKAKVHNEYQLCISRVRVNTDATQTPQLEQQSFGANEGERQELFSSCLRSSRCRNRSRRGLSSLGGKKVPLMIFQIAFWCWFCCFLRMAFLLNDDGIIVCVIRIYVPGFVMVCVTLLLLLILILLLVLCWYHCRY